MRAQLAAALESVGFACPAAVLDKFTKYYRLILDYNRQTNLTTLTSPQDFIYKHIWDSLYPGNFLRNAVSLVDVGTGPGFPGVPLKLVFPHVSLTLVEAAGKKVAFLHRCCAELGIEAEILHARAEDLGRSARREQYDCAITRAVGPMPIISEYCLPLVRPGGTFLAMKGPSVDAEVSLAQKAIEILGGRVSCVRHYELPNGDGRSLVIVEKVNLTPERFPRRPGVPAKRPL
ncbi:MAG: 16S rRNA (guanine(527)-N(7))-methyltransferase RsmG [Firmicutes bacterium]|nr:16S rRNA (guanine(527)-N(7))-methyltransferase RsmG [Bacillota bacterium]HOB34783.1 16S rRNA (guanine(527)-N(7))-methyltransferase RsmG [Bacillota bacterium]HPZ91031.1 16S rRNA (guanine(527)-N(7))-methyltransferase RsmG [Bacillota bacterium]HQE02060.1 16S rRNA (guanine(527)-N(7))-methyltransferase RsmG [Bacillota bacterium]